MSAAKSLSYIEAMNYFCEIQVEKKLQNLRSEVREEDEELENTVLVLPKISGSVFVVRKRAKDMLRQSVLGGKDVHVLLVLEQ